MHRNAYAIRDITEQMQPWIVANEPDPLLKGMWQDLSPREDVVGAGQHHSELAHRLSLTS